MSKELSKLNLTKGCLFAGAKDTCKLMAYIDNTPSKAEIGLVVPDDENKD
ncbi:hypothetical protein [Chlorogloea sp. CCALA 695]|nr:hypothetical protein [Chlorogloea sp. CCALA 695]